MGEVTADQAPSQEGALSRLTAVRLARAIRNFATSEVGTRAAALAGLLVALLLAINGLNVVNSYVGRYFMTALERRDSHEFLRHALFYVGVFAASTLAAVLGRFTEERLGLLWREWLTRQAVGVHLVHGEHALPVSHLPQWHHHYAGLFWGAVVHQPPAVHPRARAPERRVGSDAAPGSPLRGAAPAARRRLHRQPQAHHCGQSQPQLFHHGLQLPDPDHPGAHRGSALELVVGIDPARPVSDDRIWETLRLVNLDGAVRRVGGLDIVRDWRDVLSTEEQQLVGVARLLLAAPRFAVLGPLAPSLGVEGATRALAALAERGVGYVVLGDGELGRALFDAVVDIKADGAWTHTPTKGETR